MNPISNERPVSPLGNTGDVAGLTPVTQPRSETRLDAATAQATGQARKSGVSLNAPLAVSNGQPVPKQLDEVNRLLARIKQSSSLLLPHTSALVTSAFTSPEAFEIELGKLTSDLEKTQTKLKLADLKRAREQNEKKIGENQEKLKEAEESAQKAKKSGLASKIFGWISAIASMIIGTIMVATGVGAAAGALMIAAGVVGVVNMAVQQAAEDGRISPEDMKIAGPILMAVEILLAVASAVVTFGAGAVKGLAKLGVKIGFKMAGKGTSEVGLKLIKNSAKVYLKAADVSSKLAGSTASKVAKFGTQTADLIVDVSNGVTKSVDSAYQAESQNKQADLLENRQEMTALQGVIDKLKEAIAQMIEAFQQTMEMIFQMLNAKGDMMNNLARRPAAI
ncbi:type III secretion system translocon subunit AopB [Aeromonas allosaccharophila]|uniref:Type III secretion system translocon subunit AopB n=1 Tax=Aeromonas allosaccharophila TaxID=656 RepID=A0AAX3NN31_9GAMM|nr:type III secretion system translocon subunit AopB [Aeromonas allosaccharophila]WED75468.1 type III secretion system translocon subunit AopB [Aeromonas allosaccharophila]